MSMDKYGVVIDPEKEKTAEDRKTKPMCPRCGAELDSLSPPHCPVHGTEPFEPKKAESYKDAQRANFDKIYGEW